MALSEEDLERLGDVAGKTGTQIQPVSDETCPKCEATITRTDLVGEVGHRPGCSRREERYHGRAGRRQIGGSKELVR